MNTLQELQRGRESFVINVKRKTFKSGENVKNKWGSGLSRAQMIHNCSGCAGEEKKKRHLASR